MAYTASRPIVLRAQRDTIALVAAATAATFILSYSVHARRPTTQAPEPREGWAGQLPSVSPDFVAQPATETITSASLVVPKSELALPPMPVPVRTLIRLHGCEGSACVAKIVPVPAPRKQQVAIGDQLAAAERTAMIPPEIVGPSHRTTGPRQTSFMSRVNPLKHLPDMSMIKRPFAYAGDTVTGWFKRD